MRIVIKMEGGPYDEEIEGEETNLSTQAAGFYAVTEGRVGSVFMCTSPMAMEMLQEGKDLKGAGVQPHYYRINSRQDGPGEVILTAEAIQSPYGK